MWIQLIFAFQNPCKFSCNHIVSYYCAYHRGQLVSFCLPTKVYNGTIVNVRLMQFRRFNLQATLKDINSAVIEDWLYMVITWRMLGLAHRCQSPSTEMLSVGAKSAFSHHTWTSRTCITRINSKFVIDILAPSMNRVNFFPFCVSIWYTLDWLWHIAAGYRSSVWTKLRTN